MKNISKISWLQKARESWENKGDKRPPFAVVPKKGQRSVWDFPRPSIIERVRKPILVKYQERIIADSKNFLAVLETASPPTYYIPNEDVDISALVQIEGKTSMCEWKGYALYWERKDNDTLLLAWSYPKLFPEFEQLKNYLAF